MKGERLDLHVPVDDGLTVREAGKWVLVKLEILARYLPRFALACHRKAPEWYVADAFCGPGINRIRDTKELVYGSPLLALQADPAFSKVLMVDLDKHHIATLKRRVEPYGDRAIAKRADCNTELLPLMEKEFSVYGPCLAVLDPEGSELQWSTVEGIARFRKGKTKVEQLILFADNMGWMRQLPRTGEATEKTHEQLFKLFGHHGWEPIWRAKQRKEVTAIEARDDYLRMYKRGLRELGYKVVFEKPVRREGDRGRPLYHLVFATDHPAGESIMDSIMNEVRNPYQPGLFTVTRTKLPD